MTNPDNPFLPPQPPSYWSMWLVVPAAVLGVPIAGILLIGAMPHGPSTNGSVIGLVLFPFLAAGAALFAGLRVQPGNKRVIFFLLSAGWIMLWSLIFFVGMLAP
ncbi:MAG TPA: hypothetical protein VI139_08215 [Gemmatimonadales bacterium]